jgi:transcriptional regulator with XRE-family HTH domain
MTDRLKKTKASDYIGDRFKMIRKTLKLNQETFAAKLGSSLGHISEIENNKYKPGFDLLLNMETKYRVNLNYLLFNKGELFLKSNTHSIIRKYFDGLHLSKFETKFLEYFQNSLICRYKLIGYFQRFILSEKELIDLDIRQNPADNTDDKINTPKPGTAETSGEVEHFAARVTRIRRELKLIKREFAERVGISQPSVSEIEHARYKPGWDFIIKILVNCNVNPYYLFLGQEPVFIDGKGSRDFYFTEDTDLTSYEEEFLAYFRKSSIVRVRLLGYFQELLIDNSELYRKEIEEMGDE